jgi:hypothetical protein
MNKQNLYAGLRTNFTISPRPSSSLLAILKNKFRARGPPSNLGSNTKKDHNFRMFTVYTLTAWKRVKKTAHLQSSKTSRGSFMDPVTIFSKN